MPTTPTHPGTATHRITSDGRLAITFDRERLFGVRGCACEHATCTDGRACWPDEWTIEVASVDADDGDLGLVTQLLTIAEQQRCDDDLEEDAREAWADLGMRGDGTIDHRERARLRRRAAEAA